MCEEETGKAAAEVTFAALSSAAYFEGGASWQMQKHQGMRKLVFEPQKHKTSGDTVYINVLLPSSIEVCNVIANMML